MAVGIVIVIVLLSGGGGAKIAYSGCVLLGGEEQQCRVDIMQVSFVWLFLLFVFTSTILLMG